MPARFAPYLLGLILSGTMSLIVPLARLIVARPLARQIVAHPLARQIVARPVARRALKDGAQTVRATQIEISRRARMC